MFIDLTKIICTQKSGYKSRYLNLKAYRKVFIRNKVKNVFHIVCIIIFNKQKNNLNLPTENADISRIFNQQLSQRLNYTKTKKVVQLNVRLLFYFQSRQSSCLCSNFGNSSRSILLLFNLSPVICLVKESIRLLASRKS